MEDNLREKQYEFYILNERLKEYQQNLISLSKEVESLRNLKGSIIFLEEINIGEDMFVNLGHGIFIKGELKDKELLMNIGNEVLVKKTKKEAGEMINNQINEMKGVIENLKKEIENDINKIEALKKEIEEDNK